MRSLDVLANSLPVQLTSFIGRADELAAVERLLGHGQLVTLTGSGGCISRARGARGRPSMGWASLTPAELKVVSLAVYGLTNPEIAARLFVGRETVKTHLSHVYAKLAVTNRTELATLAASRPTPPPQWQPTDSGIPPRE